MALTSQAPQDAVTQVGDTGLPGAATDRPLSPGTIVGRYEIVGRLGRGGMGVVYEARDPRLRRRLAIKVIAPGRTGSKAADLLRREAVAMAQVAHPNVVTVVDVGRYDGDVYVAMELIDGQTLRAWLDARSRSTEEIVEVFRAAGAGLAALHDAGLVHRDFKPDNVMLAGERVVVMDLGLATADRDDSAPAASDRLLPVGVTTRVGDVVGTPAYMSPEQFAGRALDARTDQFSFAVALYEALVGTRPYEGEHVAQLVASLESGSARPVPRGVDVSASIRAALSRALSHDAADRFASMPALLAALKPDRRRWWGVGAGVIAAGALVGVFLVGDTKRSSCLEPERALQDAWDRPTRALVSGAFARFDSPYQRERRDVVVAELDRYAAQWGDSYAATCAAIDDGEPHAVAVMDCLQERVAELRGVCRALIEARGRGVDAAIAGTQRLTPIVACTNARGQTMTPRDRQLQLRAAEAVAALRSGTRGPATSLLDELEASSARGDVETTVRLRLRALLAAEAGDHETAAEAYEHVYFAQRSAGRDAAAFETAMALVRVHSDGRRDPAQSRHWRRELESLQAVAGTDPHSRAEYALAIGAALIVEEDMKRAEDVLVDALAEAERNLGDDVRSKADLANHVGWVFNEAGNLPRALAAYERAVELYATSTGTRHPMRGGALTNVGYIAALMDQQPVEDAAYAEAAKIFTAAFGPDSPRMIRMLRERATGSMEAGHWADARRHLEAAVALGGESLRASSEVQRQFAEIDAALTAGH